MGKSRGVAKSCVAVLTRRRALSSSRSKLLNMLMMTSALKRAKAILSKASSDGENSSRLDSHGRWFDILGGDHLTNSLCLSEYRGRFDMSSVWNIKFQMRNAQAEVVFESQYLASQGLQTLSRDGNANN